MASTVTPLLSLLSSNLQVKFLQYTVYELSLNSYNTEDSLNDASFAHSFAHTLLVFSTRSSFLT